MNNRFLYKPIILSLSLVACQSPGPASQSKVAVIEQSDSKPDWATITKSSYRTSDKMRFVGYFTAESGRPSAAIHGASTKALAMPLQSISDDFLQQSGVSEDMEDSGAKLIIASLRQNPPVIPGLQIVGSYYERVEIEGHDGVRTELRAYSLAECPYSEFNKAKTEAINRLKGDSKIKHELVQIMDQQRNKVLDKRKPAEISKESKSTEETDPSFD